MVCNTSIQNPIFIGLETLDSISTNMNAIIIIDSLNLAFFVSSFERTGLVGASTGHNLHVITPHTMPNMIMNFLSIYILIPKNIPHDRKMKLTNKHWMYVLQ